MRDPRVKVEEGQPPKKDKQLELLGEPRPRLKLKHARPKGWSPEKKRAIDMKNRSIENENRQLIQQWERRTGKKWEGASAGAWSGRKRKMK